MRSLPRDREGRVPTHNLDEIFAQVNAQDLRIGRLETSMDTLGQKMDGVIHAVTKQAAQPQFSVAAILSVVLMCSTLLGMAASSIIWISTSISAAGMASVQVRLDHDRERIIRLERALDRRHEATQ